MLTNEVLYEWVFVNTIHDCNALIDLVGFPTFLRALKASTKELPEEDRLEMIKMLEEWNL